MALEPRIFNPSLFKLKSIHYYIFGFLVVWGLLFYLNISWSRDLRPYEINYIIVDGSLVERIQAVNWLSDPGFFLIQNICVNIIPFPIFIGLIIFLSLLLKFSALLKIYSKLSILAVFPYLTLLGFMHEGTQLRVGLALGFVLWAFVFWTQKKILPALFMVVIGGLFHLSVSFYFMIFCFIFLLRKFGAKFSFLVILGACGLAIPGVSDTILLKSGEWTGARFMIYSQGIVFKVLNVTGLFKFYFLFIAFATIIVWKKFKPTSITGKYWKELALVSGWVAVAVLVDLRSFTVVASRLADIALLPLSVAYGFLLLQLAAANEKKWMYLVLSLLVIYCLIRGYTIFSPRALSPAPVFIR